MKRGQISNIFRKLRLLYFADGIRFYIQKLKNRKLNNEFKKNSPDVALPPDYLIYEAFQLNYREYYVESAKTAAWLRDHLSEHIDLSNIKILDWGCGPGRVIRHIPSVFGKSCEYYGTDYNEKSIAWCKKNLPGISFNKNSLEASLPYKDNTFDIVYGLSIITHLSEKMHYSWYNELLRTLKPGGILFLTGQGNNFKCKLSGDELRKFDSGELIVRGNVKEGHRTFSAFHPKAFMEKLFDGQEIIDHIEIAPQGNSLPQDIWMVRKR